MRNHLKKVIYLVIVYWLSVANAGSYEDFFTAVKRDDADAIVELLDRGFDPNSPDPQGNSGLHLALRDASLKAARALIESPRTRVESRTAHDESPLMMAALKGHLDLAKKLIERDADVNKTGWTPLHYAATGGHVAVMDLLLEHHAYIDAESPNGTTPLMMAAQYGSPEAVQFLLKAGADPNLKNQLGLTALDFARRGNRPDSIDLITWSIRSAQPRGKW